MANTFIDVATWEHSDDAGYKAWGSEFNNMLSVIGLTQTGDTGQVNWATTTRPGTNTYNYEIWRFNDTLQSTAPIYIRFDYGTGSSGGTAACIKITIGTGSNGAGTITGVWFTQSITNSGSGAAPQSTTQGYVSHACYNPTYGVLNVAFKKKGAALTNPAPLATFSIQRTVDQSTGLPNATGVWCVAPTGNYNTGAPTSYSYNFVTGATYAMTNTYCTPVGGLASSMVPGTLTAQVFPCKAVYPQELWANQIGVVIRNEFQDNVQFSLTILGTTALNYIIFDTFGVDITPPDSGSGTHNFAYLFQ